MLSLGKMDRSIPSDTTCWHLSLFCHEDTLAVLRRLSADRSEALTELREAVEDSVVLTFGAVRTLGGTVISFHPPLETLLPKLQERLSS